MANARVFWLVISVFLMAGMLAGCAATPSATAPKQDLMQRDTPAPIKAPSQVTPTIEAPAEETPTSDDSAVVNILLLGVDSWDALSGRSDAIVVVSVDLEHERVLLTSVPRDLQVSLGTNAEPQRINAAYAYGGAELARATLEQVLEVDIPYYAVVNFSGFARIVDTLGGVTIDVPDDIVDLQFPAMNGIDYEPYVLKAGVHQFDGDAALKYTRTRKSSPNGDFSRMDRQLQVMRALKAQVLTPRTLLQVPALYREMRNAVDTNITLEMTVRLAWLASTIDGDAVNSYAIDEDSGLVTARILDGMFVLQPDLVGIRAAVHERIVALADESRQVAGAETSP